MELSYNSRNFVTKRTDGEGYTSRWFYDRMGNLTDYYPAENWKEQTGVDENKNCYLLSFVYEDKVIYTISYDDIGYPENAVKIMSDDILKNINM